MTQSDIILLNYTSVIKRIPMEICTVMAISCGTYMYNNAYNVLSTHNTTHILHKRKLHNFKCLER